MEPEIITSACQTVAFATCYCALSRAFIPSSAVDLHCQTPKIKKAKLRDLTWIYTRLKGHLSGFDTLKCSAVGKTNETTEERGEEVLLENPGAAAFVTAICGYSVLGEELPSMAADARGRCCCRCRCPSEHFG
jgi:hypothetical protein